jgi:hypothetical protein
LRTQIVARDDHPAPENAREFRFEVLSHFAGIEADRRLFVKFKRDRAAGIEKVFASNSNREAGFIAAAKEPEHHRKAESALTVLRLAVYRTSP